MDLVNHLLGRKEKVMGIAMGTLVRNALDILSPSLYYRLWTVHINSIHVGKAFPFWRKKRALKFFESVKGKYAEVTLRNELTGNIVAREDRWDEVLAGYRWPNTVNFETEFGRLPRMG